MKSTFFLRFFLFATWLTFLSAAFASLPHFSRAVAQNTLPPTWDVLYDDFESGTLDKWKLSSSNYPVLAPGAGYNNTIGLSVDVSSDKSYLFQTKIAQAKEGYITFWFNPNGVNIPENGNPYIPDKSIVLAEAVNNNDWWPPLVSLYMYQPAGQAYQVYLVWSIDDSDQRYYDYENAFSLVNGWQQITVGYHINEWVAVWHNGELIRYATNVVNTDPYGDTVLVGKIRSHYNNSSGLILFDNVGFKVPRIDDLWVDVNTGSDNNDGFTPASALRTIQRSADLAGPGTTVHIMPGVYRETITPMLNGSASEPVHYIAEVGRGTVVIRGSEPSLSMEWTQLTGNTIDLPPGVDPNHIYSTDLSAWNLNDPPRFVFEPDSDDHESTRLLLAREPDWNVVTQWKYHEFWWAAEGGSSRASCNPVTDPDPNCDFGSRSTTQLTDLTDDIDPSGVEPGNLTSLGDLTGATLVAIDTVEGHYVYRRTIIAHNITAGRVTVDKACEFDGSSSNPGLGWGSKFYVEGKSYLLDTPGEWWYDANSKQLYLWPLTAGNPASMNIEISRRENGFSLRNRSYITLDGLTIEGFNGSAVDQVNWIMDKSYGNSLRNMTLRYANYGLNIEQDVSAAEPIENVIDGFTLEDSEVAYIDSQGIRLIDWWDNDADPDSFSHSGILNTTIRGNEFHHLGFRSDDDNAIGLLFTFANKLRFEENWIHHIAHNGVVISESVIQSPKEYGFDPSEIKTGDILVKDNLFEDACQLATDCSGLKVWGSPPDNHVFRNLLITANTFRDTFGWTYISENRKLWIGGENSDVLGMGAFGLTVDHASGIHIYRNIAYNNAFSGYGFGGLWRDGEIVIANNLAANSLYAIRLTSGDHDTHGSVNTQVINNIIINNEGFGLLLEYAEGRTINMTVDHNLYFNNGWRPYEQGGFWGAGVMLVREGGPYDPYPTLTEVQANTPWEDHSLEGDPAFWSYDPKDHELHDGSWPDFHLTTASSNVIDRGKTSLPASLTTLLDAFGVVDYQMGSAYDIGRYEAGFLILVTPTSQGMDTGGTVNFTLRLFPSNTPYTVTLNSTSPSPYLTLSLSPAVITGAQVATLTVTDKHPGLLMPGERYVIPIIGMGSGFTNIANISILVGGYAYHLPIIENLH